MDVRMLEADANELRQVLGLDPDRQPPLVERFVVDIADAYARHAQPVLVGIERADRLAEGLADAVSAVGTNSHVHADFPRARIEADRMIGGCEDDTFDAATVTGVEHIVAADNIGLVDGVPRTFDGVAA